MCRQFAVVLPRIIKITHRFYYKKIDSQLKLMRKENKKVIKVPVKTITSMTKKEIMLVVIDLKDKIQELTSQLETEKASRIEVLYELV